MNAEQNPFLRYELLLRQYSERVEPLLSQLHDRVDNELNLIRQQEASLLAARTQALEELQTAIGVDARFLLKTARFQEFFNRYLNVKSTYYRDKTPQVDEIVANWSLVAGAVPLEDRFVDRPLRVFAYQEKFEPDDYDDERTYASYSFNVKVAWDATTIDITDIKTFKIYGLNDDRRESFADIAKLISWQLGDFSKNKLPIEELSYLITYCCLLLAQKPSTVEFAYNSASEGKHDLWELPI
jgi:hypothetical protein